MRLPLLLTAGLLAGGIVLAQEADPNSFAIAVDETGAIRLPDVDFRAEWTMLGAWSIAGEDGADGLHNVYAQSDAVRHCRETGAFADGAVLIKELLDTRTEDMTMGRISHAGEPAG